jgi:hypothetical protein
MGAELGQERAGRSLAIAKTRSAGMGGIFRRRSGQIPAKFRRNSGGIPPEFRPGSGGVPALSCWISVRSDFLRGREQLKPRIARVQPVGRSNIGVSSPRLPRLRCQRSAGAWSVFWKCKVQNAKCQAAAEPLKAGVRSINISKSAVGGRVGTQHDCRRCFCGEVHRVCTRRACSQAEWSLRICSLKSTHNSSGAFAKKHGRGISITGPLRTSTGIAAAN